MQSDTYATHVVGVYCGSVSKVVAWIVGANSSPASSTGDLCGVGANIASNSPSAFGVSSDGW
jgi:hypothetical protein